MLIKSITQELVSTSTDKIINATKAVLELHDNFILRRLVYDGESKHEDTGVWAPYKKYAEYSIRRDLLVGVDLAWVDEEELWRVTAVMHGVGDWWFYIRSMKEARALRDTLHKYIYNPELQVL